MQWVANMSQNLNITIILKYLTDYTVHNLVTQGKGYFKNKNVSKKISGGTVLSLVAFINSHLKILYSGSLYNIQHDELSSRPDG